MAPGSKPATAVLIPCYNEGATINAVVRAFRAELPDAVVYVYDNNSSDVTAEEARRAGAVVRTERRQGKGHVVRSMFSQVDADVYVMVDGDETYPADRVGDLVRPIVEDEADMVIGSRLHSESDSHFRLLNRIGNRLYRLILNTIFSVRITDLLSGYRAFSRRVVKSLPVLSRGFEIETELTVKCLERGYRIAEVPVSLAPRPKGSHSKIKIVRDGVLILNTLFALFRDYRPLTAFGSVGLALVLVGLIPGTVVVREYLATGYILRVPSAILAVGFVLSGVVAAFAGLILHTIARRFQEVEYQLQALLDRAQR